MTATRRRRTDPSQPELPLLQQPVEPARAPDQGHRHRAASGQSDRGQGEGGPGHGRQWRLDEHTRQIGRRGVALARAQLRRAEATGVADGQGRGRGPSGRAA